MSLNLKISKESLINLTDKQLEFFMCTHSVRAYVDVALQRVEYCFGKITNKYFQNSGGGVFFSPFQSAQYAQYLYFLSRIAYLNEDIEVAEKTYYLNKMLNSVDWFYEVQLPDIFFADHPVGCVLGRAKYSNRFSVAQGCTVGNNHGIYPEIGENVTMHSLSMIVGASKIGNNVEIGAKVFICDEIIPDNCIVFGQTPDLIIVKKDYKEMRNRLTSFKY